MDPSKQRIIISRDVIFDEEKSWNWNAEQKDNSRVFNLSFGKLDDQVTEEDEDVEENNGSTRVMSEAENHKEQEEESIETDEEEEEEDEQEQDAPK